MPESPRTAPAFLWGTATSSHQIEGHNRANDWWAWETQGRLKEPSLAACDHYERFEEDVALIAGLGHNAHRFSLEWSRFEPEEGRWNEEAFKHYDEVFQALKNRGIEPVVTLHHFTNPEWFSLKGGWLQDRAVFYFSRYVERVVKAYGRYVKYWITINEPTIYIYFGFYEGSWPPGNMCYRDAMKVFRQLLLAHMEAYRIIHRHYEEALQKPAAVSIAQHMTYFTPCRHDSFGDRWAVFLRDWFVNHLFWRAGLTGHLFFPGIFSEFLGSRGCFDFLGLNYYTRDFIRFGEWFGEKSVGGICDKAHHRIQVRESSAMGWEVHAGGLYELLKRLRGYRLPVMVTENGIATREDAQRVRFIREHTHAVHKARHAGVPVMGYFYWSLLDNFEWAHGFDPRFGIIEVDYQSQERKLRPSAHVLSECCRKIEHELSRA